MARPHRLAAVIRGRIAEHVEEQAVDLVAIERLAENLQRVLAVVAAVDADRIQAVVDRRLAIDALEEPLRMRVEHGLLRLAQIEAADHAHAARVRQLDDVAKQIASRRQVRARIVERHAASDTGRRCRPC